MMLCMQNANHLAETAAELAALLADMYEGDCILAGLLAQGGVPHEEPTWQTRAALGWGRMVQHWPCCQHPECLWRCCCLYYVAFEAAWHEALGDWEVAA